MSNVGWYLLPSGGYFYGTLPPGAVDLGAPGSVALPYDDDGQLPEGVEGLAQFPALSNWWQKLAAARAGGLAAMCIVIGDSRAEGFTTTRYRNRWVDQLRRRFQGATPGSMGFLPAAANAFSTVVDVDWAGGDNPWTYSGVTGSVANGIGLHAAQCTAGSITLTYFGYVVQLYYTRTPTGPAAATVTLDGVAQTALNAQGSNLPGQVASYGSASAYGFHTLVITVASGTLVFEGALWYDGGAFNGFTVNGDVLVVDGTHAGFGMKDWAGPSNDWSGMFNSVVEYAYAGLVLWCNGTNDAAAGRTPKQFEDDCVTAAQRLDARMLKSDLSHLFCILPSSNEQPYVDAAYRAAARLGLSRAGVLDLGSLRPSRTYGGDMSSDGSHPNDAGHRWMAERIGSVLDPFPATRNPVTPARQIIDASTPAAFRSSWTEAWTALTGSRDGIDTSGGGTTVGERRHRVWLDAGTYRSTITMQEDTGLGTVEVLIGRTNGATAELVSCGTKANAAGSPTLVKTRLATSVVNHTPGWYPVVIRKTSASGAIRFVELAIDKTA